jgi:AraC-like DNA-binding protein
VKRYTTQVREILLLLGAAEALGLARGELLRAAGLSAEQLRDPEARISHLAAMALWEEIPRRAGREHFGLELASLVPLGHHDVVDYVARHSGTLGEAFEQVIRFQRLMFDGGAMSLEIDDGGARLRHALRDGSAVPRHLAETVLALFLLRGRSFVEAPLAPVEVRFRHAAPADTAPHGRLFGGRVRFDQPATELVFAPEAMRLPVSAPDPTLRGVLERHAVLLLSRVTDPDDLVSRVRKGVGSSIKSGVPAAAAVARRLGMSERTLHRRLAGEGHAFQDLVDGVRKEIALEHIRDRDAPIAEVAFLLGFSEASSFHRAFRRWTGTTPALYRRAVDA